MYSENSKASDPHRLLLNLTDKIDLRRKDEYIALSNLSNYYTWKNIKKSQKNKFKIPALTQSEEFKLPDGSYSIHTKIVKKSCLKLNRTLSRTFNA